MNRICWRLVLYKNTSKGSTIEWTKLSNLSLRSISTSKPLLENNDCKSPVKIYTGVLSSQIKLVKVFSLSSSIIGMLAQPLLYKEIVSTGSVPMIVAAYSFVGLFTFVTPLLLHLITKKYVTSLEYYAAEDKYIAYTINFFCIPKKIEFKVREIDVPELPGMFTSIKVKGKALFFDPSNFDYPDHYAILMGYDKPIDFKLGESSTSDKSSVNSK